MAKKRPGKAKDDGSSDRRRAAREHQLQQAAAMKRRRNLVQAGIIAGVAILVIGIVASAVIIGQRGRGDGSVPSADATVQVDDAASVPFAIDGSAVRIGPADAKAQVDLWVDYSCPHCKDYEAENSGVLNQLVAAGDVSVKYHNIQIVTPYGTAAGNAAACVATHDPDKWIAFNSALYANHSAETDGWSAPRFRDFADQQGINSAALNCIGNNPYSSWITSNTAASSDAGVDGTPTMFLNGKKTDAPLTGDALVAKVNQLAGR